jgi:hypothetical protein
MNGLLAFCLWFAGASAIVIGVTVSDVPDVLVGVLCIIAGEVTAG